MAVKVRTVRGGTNTYQTPAEDFNWLLNQLKISGVIEENHFKVEAQTTPNMTVKVNAGNLVMKATPTNEAERYFGVELTTNANVAIASNTSGATKYDLVYVKLPADTLHDPPANGDFTESATLKTERHNNSGESLNDTNGYVLAEVRVVNGATSITNADITDKRTNWRIPSAKTKLTCGKIAATSNLTLTTTALDVPGASLSITPSVNSFIIITAVFDFYFNYNDGGQLVKGVIIVDGNEYSGSNRAYLSLSSGTTTSIEATVVCTAVIPLTPTNHIIKLQAFKTGGSGNSAVYSPTTNFSYILVSQ